MWKPMSMKNVGKDAKKREQPKQSVENCIILLSDLRLGQQFKKCVILNTVHLFTCLHTSTVAIFIMLFKCSYLTCCTRVTLFTFLSLGAKSDACSELFRVDLFTFPIVWWSHTFIHQSEHCSYVKKTLLLGSGILGLMCHFTYHRFHVSIRHLFSTRPDDVDSGIILSQVVGFYKSWSGIDKS